MKASGRAFNTNSLPLHADTRERSFVLVVFPIGLDLDSILAWWRQGAGLIDLKGMNPLSV
jgi:hypothetical protein